MGFNYPQGKSRVLQEQLWLSQHVPLCFSPHSFLTPAHHRFPGTSSSVTCWLGKLERLSNPFLPVSMWIIFITGWFGRCFLEISTYLFIALLKDGELDPPTQLVKWDFPRTGIGGRNLRFKSPSLLIMLFTKLSIHFQIWKELQDAETNSFLLATSLGKSFIANAKCWDSFLGFAKLLQGGILSPTLRLFQIWLGCST